MELTGAEQPALLEEDAPILSDSALESATDEGFYLVGLIGGKDVGKSALINALVGKPITEVTSHGAGTETAIAYAHRSQEAALRQLLDREVAGQYRVITHDQASLRRQVLLDLPDIDSKYASHLQITRAMLRHMLYPVWVSSVEKYADQQPQQMLAKVADGNTPSNFVFVLTKADQLSAMVAAGEGFKEGFGVQGSGFRTEEKEARADSEEDPSPTPWKIELDDAPSSANLEPRTLNPPADPLEELRSDYALRVQRTLELKTAPRVLMVSSKSPQRFDMEALRTLLCRQRSDQAVRESKQLAAARQDTALFNWLDAQQLSMRAERLGQLEQDAEELIATRVGRPLLERIIPRILDDPGTRMAMADEILQERVARWPIVNLIHTLLQPIFLLARSAMSRNAAPLLSADALVDGCVKESGESFEMLIQSTFAQLRQQQPMIASLYGQNRLWESMPAEFAAGSLHRALADAVQRQRETARQILMGRNAAFAAPVRWLLTIGALIWFPFAQPILAAALGDPNIQSWAWRRLAALVVDVLGVNYMLRSATFLLIYYAALWLALRWNTQRRVGRLVAKWKASDFPDTSVNLATQALQWLDELSSPIRLARDRMQSLTQRVDDLRKKTRAA